MTEINKRILIFLILILFISSCASEIETTEQVSPTLISNTETPTTLPTVENTLSPTPESDTLIQVEKSCMELENLPENQNLSGVFIRQYTYPYLENLDENTKYRVPLDGGGILETYEGYWSISPNGKWLAYLDRLVDISNPREIVSTEGFSLKVIHSSGHSLSMDYWPITYQSILGWVDDQNLLLKLDSRDIVLNPFSGKWYEIETPDWLREMNLKDSWGGDAKKYSPNLNQVIVYLDSHSELRDINSGEIIFGNGIYGDFVESVWSPGGIMLAIVTNNGNVLRVFQENEEILTINFLQMGILDSGYITKMEWSLNGKSLIIEASDDLLILDVNEKKLYGICFSDEKLERVWFRKSFFYMENGKYLVTSLYLRDESYSFETFDVLIDFTNMRAYKLDTPKYKQRIGWLVLP